ncbi:uncharacterized protein LOC111322856 [Stylophora pistillata]|uniref:uncharacterized protein LOC111322856 n=1 Tax=Stylophora pistillata TaxID=50429 RepID=UPI000C05345E|nr:uncharacterized protein LOC111322856 [Stylophora pistillata]
MTSEIGLAISEHGRLAVVKRSEGRIELTCSSRDVHDSSHQTITEDLLNPYDICFAPNNLIRHLHLRRIAAVMARSMVQSLQSDRMAISEEGQVAVIKTLENCIEIYGEDVDFGIEWMARRIAVGLLKPCDLCFAPNNALVVSDIGDDTLKIYDLKGDLQLKNQIVVCRDTLGRLMVRELNSDFRMIKFRTSGVPVTVVIGPGPLSQLFITRRTEVILVNVDWNKVSLVSYLLISSPLDWRLLQFDKRSICDNVSSVKDHKNNHKVGGFNPMAITEAQFCGMFYHVAETNRTRFSCLERSKCNVGIRGDRRKFSETVVIYVRITEENGRLLFHARYGNCYEGAYESTTHAEYFMLVDDDFREAVKILQNQNGGDINLFMNKQPCYKSTGHGKKTDLKVKECAQDLTNFYNLYCLPYRVKLTINLCQLYKIDMSPSSVDRSLASDIVNARVGVKMMLSSGIKLLAMREESWKSLAEISHIPLPAYEGSDRQKLDQYIDLVISKIKGTPFHLLTEYFQLDLEI